MFNKLKQEAEYQAESLSEKGSWATSKPGVMGVQTWCEDARARELEPKGNLGYSQAWSYMGVQTWCEDAWARATGATGAWAAKGKLLSGANTLGKIAKMHEPQGRAEPAVYLLHLK